jgi:hypothetical protein
VFVRSGRRRRDTRLTCWFIVLVACGAMMWRPVVLRWVTGLLLLVHETGGAVPGMGRAAGSAALVLVGEATPLRPEPALFEAMLEGWRRQQAARRLSIPLVDGRVRLVRRFQAFTVAVAVDARAGRGLDLVRRVGALDSPVV